MSATAVEAAPTVAKGRTTSRPGGNSSKKRRRKVHHRLACRRRTADLVILDTAPEADQARALEYLKRADWVLVPVKGPEKDSVQALPMLMGWIRQVRTVRLIGFLPTMHKPRRASSKYWLAQLERLAERNDTRVLAPINDLASIADKTLAGHPYEVPIAAEQFPSVRRT